MPVCLKCLRSWDEGWFETVMRHTFTMKRSLTYWNKYIYIRMVDSEYLRTGKGCNQAWM